VDRAAVSPFQENQILGQLNLIGRSRKGPKWNHRYFKTSLNVADAMALLSAEHNRFGIELEIQSDELGTYGGSATWPFGRVIASDAA
jgi:hypothetical protein